jgi:hypothetical protein
VASGVADVLARSRPPGDDADPDTELVLVRIDADPPDGLVVVPPAPDAAAP